MADNDRRQKKTHRRHRHLPPRPKKAPSAYIIFLKEYFKTHRPRNATEAREGMKTAGGIWQKKSEKEKREFVRAGNKEKAKHDRDMAKWRLQKNLVKQPASSYALFLKATWEAERDSGRNIADMSEHASDLWRGMDDTEKGVYLQGHKDLAQNYYQTMERLDSGDLKIEDVSPRTNGSIQKNRGRGRKSAQMNESDEEEEEEDEVEEDADEEMAEDADEADGDEEEAEDADADSDEEEELMEE